MTNQSSLFNLFENSTPDKRVIVADNVKITAWNLQSPSIERVRKQIPIICATDANIIILSELKCGKALNYMVEELQINGYQVFNHCAPELENDFHTIIISKNCNAKREFELESVQDFGSRTISISLETISGTIAILGLYCPTHSRFATSEDIVRKTIFHKKLNESIHKYTASKNNRIIIAGDFNLLEPNHRPEVAVFRQMAVFYTGLIQSGLRDAFRCLHPNAVEHSWISPRGDERWRLDHMLVDERLVDMILSCSYEHSYRKAGLSDHSGITLVLRTQAI